MAGNGRIGVSKSGSSGGGGGGDGAPTNATYITVSTNGTLSAERTIAPGDGLSGTDAGAGGNYTLDVNVAKSVVIAADAIELSGDSSSPGNNKVYGTDGSGVKGWKSDPSTSVVDSLNMLILNPIDRTYVLDSYAPGSYTINSIGIKCSTGTCTAAIQIGGVNVTSLSGLSISSANTTASASGANSVVAGDRVTLVVTSSSVIQDLELSLKVTR